MKPGRVMLVAMAGVLTASACTTSGDDSTATTTTEAQTEAPVAVEDETQPDLALPDLEVALVWHQHQPRYPVIDGEISRPWVRLHAAKDYVDMATLVEEFPDLDLTINLTPVLLDQLVELESGVRDTYWVVAETPIDELTEDQRQFIVDRFFDVNGTVLERFPRYVELRTLRSNSGGSASSFADGDLRDLRALFHLAWLDPEMPEYVSLLDSVGGPDEAQNFSDEDTAAILAAHERLVSEVIPTHARLWEEGQIEVTTTPLAHPILPLIADTSLAQVGDPAAVLPRSPFREYLDAAEHVERGLDRAEELLGQRPNGMWPGEGAVAQAVMPIFADNEVAWVATGEDVLAQSLGLGGFDRDENDVVQDATLLYRPWQVDTANGSVDMFFRDNRISDLLGFEYSGREAEEAAEDFISRLDDIRHQLAGQELDFQPIVSVILDGENAWEHYPNDGRDFLRALYRKLTTSEWLSTTTPTRYLEEHPDESAMLDDVFPAAWFSPDFGTWIGEIEEQRAWELLRLTRLALREAEQGGDLSPEQYEAAFHTMLEAEGSDWFWWYGSDQESGNDRYFDDAFRELMGQVYDQIGEPRPRWIEVPIIPDASLQPSVVSGEPVTIEIDGNPADWAGATTFQRLNDTDELFELGVAIDESQFAIRIDGDFTESFEIYIGAPRGTSRRGTTIDDRLLGFDATHLVRYNRDEGACISGTLLPVTKVGEYPRSCTLVDSALSEAGLEIGIPSAELGALAAGDQVLVRIASPAALNPSEGAVAIPVPDIAGFEPVVSITDPEGDDTGPGGYSYPTDVVFGPGAFDLVGFEAGTSGSDAVFSFEFAGAVTNPWGSASGLSIQTIDVYLDFDPGAATGRRDLLDGRNASLEQGDGWEAAVTIEGWDSAVATVNDDGGYDESSPTIGISVLGEQGRVTVRIPLSSLPEGFDPATVGYAVAVLSQEGFPSPGVRRVRDVDQTASQWRLGGGDSGAGDTRIIDALHQDGSEQAKLSDGIMPLVLS